ncbi:MAG: hypothetical protein Q7T70_02565 [Polaromonas sp.]|nr:hypothetical protein [Polaromonas sp.]
MKILSAATIAAMSAPVLRVAQLVYMQFGSSVVALNSMNRDIVWGSATYRGAAGLGTISQIDDSPGEIKGIQLQISGVPSEYLALALADATVVQGGYIAILLAILDEGGAVVEAALDWVGTIDTMPIEENGETCSISVTAESSAVDLLRGTALTTSNADQQFLYPGDRAFEWVIPQEGVPIVWPTKQYYIDSR